MSNQPPNNPLQLILSILQGILELFISAIQSRDAAKLTLLVMAVLILCFNFDIGGLKQKVEQSPAKEVFWGGIAVLFVTSLLFELRKRSQQQVSIGRNRSRLNWMQSHWVRYCLFGLITATLTLLISEVFEPVFATQISEYICNPRTGQDCFSWGENILIDKDPAFTVEVGDPPTSWKKRCEGAWDWKINGVLSYKDSHSTSDINVNSREEQLDKAISNFTTFLLPENCPNDPETLIYLNNAKAEKEKDFLRVVVSVPISRKYEDEKGDGTSVSLEILRGVALAQDENNADNSSEIGSRKRKLVVGIVDDGPIGENKPSGESKIDYERRVAEEAAKFVVQNQDVLGVIGHFTSDTTQAASQIYGHHKLVSISPTSTAIRKTTNNVDGIDFLFGQSQQGTEGANYVFRTATDDSIAIQSLKAEILNRKQDFRKMAVIYESGSRYSESFRDAFTKDYTGNNVKGVMFTSADNQCNLAPTNVQQNSEDCSNLLKNEPGLKALLLVPPNASSGKLREILEIKDEQNKGSEQQFFLSLLGADSMYDKTFLTKATEGMVVAVPWHRPDTSTSLFEKKATDRFGYGEGDNRQPFEVNWRTAMAYDATKAISEGLARASISCRFSSLQFWDRQAKSKCLREKLRNALSDIQNFKADGVLGEGTVQFDEKGDRKKIDGLDIGVLVEVCKKDNGSGYAFKRVGCEST
ncbi:amino acid ABC transporter substrate-binding protein [Oscillatoria sp. FACHB-1407]|uniref:ABC transporter substrate-binding protein n=1 Tax=Oscillatoria sp. FACHB-1407 TaxID=2692847 RepID=UPI0016851D68|nr:ABC transporter substrate-binding protein [Oscillatoria sp. FACHB-1407]MBD2460137.1 amino acid ABC transporter substrate-binding protein [Oscillatoria sp. FACHB-1407]